MRLIDADKLPNIYTATHQEMIMAFEESPTVEAEPVRHGHWIKYFETDEGRSLRCSKCLMVFWVGNGREGNYCPNCGAKMDEVKEE